MARTKFQQGKIFDDTVIQEERVHQETYKTLEVQLRKEWQ